MDSRQRMKMLDDLAAEDGLCKIDGCIRQALGKAQDYCDNHFCAATNCTEIRIEFDNDVLRYCEKHWDIAMRMERAGESTHAINAKLHYTPASQRGGT